MKPSSTINRLLTPNAAMFAFVFAIGCSSAVPKGHGGSGGSLLCVDPARELVVVWLSVWPDMSTTSQYGFVDALVESVVD